MSSRSCLRRFSSAAPITLMALAACSAAPPAVPEARSSKVRITAPVVAPDDLGTLASNNAAFAWDLYRAVRATPDNLVFSPASLSLALAMTYGGARGTTAAQIATTLRFTLPPERLHPAFNALDLALESRGAEGPGALELSIANALWSQRDFVFLPEFLDLLAESYGAGVHLVDFAGAPEDARRTINRWVSDETRARIPELLPGGSVDGATLVLTTAVYFLGEWVMPFAPKSPDGTFNAPGGPVTVPMMHGPVVGAWSGPGYRAARLPYKGGAASMVVVVPDAGTFEAFETGLTSDALAAILATTPGESAILSLPRFTFKTNLPLNDTLAGMGMPEAFSDAADFSGIDGARGLFIQAVIHQAFVAVDEKGTEAAAATAVVIGRTSAPAGPELRIDRPFLFAIRDDATGALLFLGRVLDPSR